MLDKINAHWKVELLQSSLAEVLKKFEDWFVGTALHGSVVKPIPGANIGGRSSYWAWGGAGDMGGW